MRAMDSVARISRLGRASSERRRFIVHSHQLLENLQVARWVVRGRQQTAEDAGFVEDQWLAALPVATKR
jgi:hypothetical protein